MKPQILPAFGVAAMLLAAPQAQSQPGAHTLHFTAASIQGAPTGDVQLAGRGAYDPASGFVRLNGTFRVLADIAQGPLSGARAGDGVRFRAVELLASSGFKCSVDAGEPAKQVTSDDRTVVFLADFFRPGDGATASFQARVFISTDDQAPEIPGVQNVWIQGVGCGEAQVSPL
jgi:hypothetical protein